MIYQIIKYIHKDIYKTDISQYSNVVYEPEFNLYSTTPKKGKYFTYRYELRTLSSVSWAVESDLSWEELEPILLNDLEQYRSTIDHYGLVCYTLDIT